MLEDAVAPSHLPSPSPIKWRPRRPSLPSSLTLSPSLCSCSCHARNHRAGPPRRVPPAVTPARAVPARRREARRRTVRVHRRSFAVRAAPRDRDHTVCQSPVIRGDSPEQCPARYRVSSETCPNPVKPHRSLPVEPFVVHPRLETTQNNLSLFLSCLKL